MTPSDLSVPNAVETAALSHWYGDQPALQDLTLGISQGGVHAIVGRNGSGKTTLLRILTGFVQPSRGRCQLLGEDCRKLPAAVRGRVALVSDEHALPPWLSAEQLVGLQRASYPTWDQTLFDQIVDLFSSSPTQRVDQLSRGERAGLCLALALATRPQILLLDEPTLGLDVVASRAILEVLLLASEPPDRTVILCTHQMDEVERLADQLIILNRGRLVAASEPEAFRDRFSSWVAEGIPASSVGSVEGLVRCRTIDDQLHLVTVDRDPNLVEELRGLGATRVTRSALSLDRAIEAVLSQPGA